MSIIATLFLFYWLPTIIAIVRQTHSALAVFLINLFLTWTVIGWFVALFWALGGDNRTVIVHVDRDHSRP